MLPCKFLGAWHESVCRSSERDRLGYGRLQPPKYSPACAPGHQPISTVTAEPRLLRLRGVAFGVRGVVSSRYRAETLRLTQALEVIVRVFSLGDVRTG